MTQDEINAAILALDNMDDYAKMECGIDPIGARGVLEKFIRKVAAEGDSHREFIGHPMTERKTKEIESRGFRVVGYVMQKPGGEYCISSQGAVRWLPSPHYWRLMHEQNNSLFSEEKS